MKISHRNLHLRFVQLRGSARIIVTLVQYRCINLFHINITPSIRIEDFGSLNVCMKTAFLSIAFISIWNSFYAAIIYTIVILKKLLLIFEVCISLSALADWVCTVLHLNIYSWSKKKPTQKQELGTLAWIDVPIQGFRYTLLPLVSLSCPSGLSFHSCSLPSIAWQNQWS